MRDLLTPPAAEDPAQVLLADALEEYWRRTSTGEPVDLGDFRDRLGATYARFERVLEADRALSAALGDGAAPGERFPRPFGPFLLLGELGQGGMGVVYEAMEQKLGRRVAVKVLHARFQGEGEVYRRFEREARSCARVRHDCIVAIHEVGLVDGKAYYSMDLVEGAPLSRLIAERRLPDLPALAVGLAGLADALAELHAQGLIHRDVKPQNILVRRDGRMILADFGLARHVEDETLTRVGGIVGTPAYMSPEQILGQTARICPATDVYGLGVSLYECLTGHVPFRVREYAELIESIRSETPTWPEAVEGPVAAALRRVATKALYKDPSDRYRSAGELARDLRLVAQGQAPEGRLVSRMDRSRRWLVRRAKPLAVAATLLVGLVFALAHRPATLVLEAAVPEDAMVYVDDVERGRTPLRLSVAPGQHRVVLARRGFRSEERVLEVGAGDAHTAELRPLKPNDGPGEERPDPETLAAYGYALGRRYGLPMPDGVYPPQATGTRGGAEAPSVTVIAPRGRVRPEDLTAWWVEVDPEVFVPGGTLQLRHGERVLWRSEAFTPTSSGAAVGRLQPDPAILAGLEPGALLTFLYVPPGDEGRVGRVGDGAVELRLAAQGEASDTLARLAKALPPEQAAFASGLRAAALRGSGLATAAVREACAALRADGKDRVALGILRWTLRDLGLDRSGLVQDTLGPAQAAGTSVALPAFGAP